jgi:hypothetical protein
MSDGQHWRVVEWDTEAGVPYLVVERWSGLPNVTTGDVDSPVVTGWFCLYVNLPDAHPPLAEGERVDGHEVTYGPDSCGWVGFDTAHVGMGDYTAAHAVAETRDLAVAVADEREAND